MSEMFKMYQTKKRAVDPNAPPRPNLMTHDVKIRTAQQTIDEQTRLITMLQIRVEELERKVRSQTQYLSQLHSRIK